MFKYFFNSVHLLAHYVSVNVPLVEHMKCSCNLYAASYLHSFNPYPTAFPYGNGMVLHFYQQQESSTTKTEHKVINKGLKAYVWSPHTGENFH